MDAGTLLAIFKSLSGPLVRALSWVTRRIRISLFKRRERKLAPGEIDAIRVARASLGGSVLAAVPFRNLGSPSQFLAVARQSSDEERDLCFYVLEKVGGAYTLRWASDKVWGDFDRDKFVVADIDGDGCKEVAYEVVSFGSGGGFRSLYVYSTASGRLAEVTEFYNFSDATGPGVSPIRIEAGDDARLRQAVIKLAHAHGLLQDSEPVDYDLPKFAVLRWHKENGSKRAGVIKIHLYLGEPEYGNSVEDELDTGDVVWTAYFKGPLCGSLKSRSQHFIAYSPASVYEWPKSLAFDGQRLWFVAHCIPGLFSYQLETSTLRHYCGYKGVSLPDIYEISRSGDALSINTEGEQGFEIRDTDALMECQTYCLLNEPHLPSGCDRRRHRKRLEALISELMGSKAED